MLVVETVARIRREHFVKGKTIKEIARDLGVSRNTLRKVLRPGETSFEYERLVQPRPKLEAMGHREKRAAPRKPQPYPFGQVGVRDKHASERGLRRSLRRTFLPYGALEKLLN